MAADFASACARPKDRAGVSPSMNVLELGQGGLKTAAVGVNDSKMETYMIKHNEILI